MSVQASPVKGWIVQRFQCACVRNLGKLSSEITVSTVLRSALSWWKYLVVGWNISVVYLDVSALRTTVQGRSFRMVWRIRSKICTDIV